MHQQTPEFFKIKTEILQGLLQYLASKPYSEVAEIIAILKNSEPYYEIPDRPSDEVVQEDTAGP